MRIGERWRAVDVRRLIERLREERERRGLSLYRVTQDSGVGYRHVRHLLTYPLREDTPVYLDPVVRIAIALGLDPAEVIRDALTEEARRRLEAARGEGDWHAADHQRA